MRAARARSPRGACCGSCCRAWTTGADRYSLSRWSEDDDAYIAEVPELSGCMADGRTYEEAIKNTLNVIKEWIETAMELGREIPKPKGRLIYA